MGAREARDLIENHGVRGFKFHGIMQNIHPADPVGYPIYEVIAGHKLPAIFHTGHSGMGSGLPGGGGVRLKWGQPMLIDDVAVDFPDMKIVLAHPSWPWVDESLSMALHKENVFIDLSGWSPKYFQPQVIQYANGPLKKKMMFGSDFPLIRPEKWLEAAQHVGFKPEVLPGLIKDNAARLLGLK
jgi:predicted TIM-barrel fold metal-dependent hydrolase